MSEETNLERAISQVRELEKLNIPHLRPYIFIMKAETLKYILTPDEELQERLTLGDVLAKERKDKIICPSWIKKVSGILYIRNDLVHAVHVSTDPIYVEDIFPGVMNDVDAVINEYLAFHNYDKNGKDLLTYRRGKSLNNTTKSYSKEVKNKEVKSNKDKTVTTTQDVLTRLLKAK